jgi:hypothetical protein
MHLLVGVLLKVRIHYCVAVGVGQDTNMLDTLLLLLLSGMQPLQDITGIGLLPC